MCASNTDKPAVGDKVKSSFLHKRTARAFSTIRAAIQFAGAFTHGWLIAIEGDKVKSRGSRCKGEIVLANAIVLEVSACAAGE